MPDRMPSRSSRLALSIAVTGLLAAAAPAAATPPFTPACAGNWDCVGLDDPAMGDGVIVHWRVQSPTTQTIALETRQRLSGGGTVLTATTAPITVDGGGVRELDARLPIADRGVLAIAGASGPIQAEGVMDSDYDGDGYGDRTQDACFKDFNAHAAPCPAVTSFGSALRLAPDPGGFSPSGGGATALVQTPATAPVPGARTDGVITALRLRSASAAPLTVQTLRPNGSGAYTVTGAAAPATPAAGGAITTVTGVRLPVKAGDQLGLRSPGDLGAVAPSGSALRAFAPPPSVGDTATPAATSYQLQLLAQADVEEDADGDGYGDLSQDACPFDATRHAGCQADLAVVNLFSSKTVAPGNDAFFELWVTNRGPDPAKDVDLRATLPPGTVLAGNVAPCPSVDGVARCHAARLDAGEWLAARFFVHGAPGSTATSTATASSTTADADLANNSLTWTATFLPFATAPAPPVAQPAPPPCTNVIRGTRDDDVLRGTLFGDRLVGSDGDDLLKGSGADDCLEGGTGDDVLDGGDGNDRLSGSSGRDRLLGGKGNDRLTGGKGNDRLSAGAGNDTLSPGAGHDAIDAGAGNDAINAVDGVRETVDCGSGRDTVRADRRDRLRHCEKVTRRR
jgi:uncharacterized repeat protein (TIGR01451 family)